LGLNQYLSSIAKNWWLIVIVALVFAGVTAALASRTKTEYRTRASLALAPAPALEDTRQQLDTLLSMRSQLITTLTKIVTSGVVLESAGDGNYVDELDRGELYVTANEIPDSLVVEINVTGERPEVVEVFITDVVDAATLRFEELFEVSIVEPLDPGPQVTPSRPSVRRRVLVAGMVGLGVGFLLGLLRDALARPRSWKRSSP
jgi:capsular polysaccharide biosynthesis protein